MQQRSLIQEFLDYWSENGAVSALQRTWWYISNSFRFRFWDRSSLYLKILEYRIKVLQFLSRDSVSDAEPFKIIFVDPSKIQYEAGESGRRNWGKVAQGTWETTPIEERERYQAYEQYIKQNTEHPDISDRMMDLVANLKENGYITQKELMPITHHIPFYYRDLEIGVNIDKDGELYWVGWGRNRLCAAKVLELDEIAVQVHERHKEWQKIRDEVRTASSIAELSDETKSHLDHPDLRDIR